MSEQVEDEGHSESSMDLHDSEEDSEIEMHVGTSEAEEDAGEDEGARKGWQCQRCWRR